MNFEVDNTSNLKILKVETIVTKPGKRKLEPENSELPVQQKKVKNEVKVSNHLIYFFNFVLVLAINWFNTHTF